MKTKTVITVLLMVIILTSCAPMAASIPATFTAVPTSTAIPPTEQPHILLQQDTILYSGPGNIDFEPIATLKASEIVYPLGTYVDFVQVATKIEGNEIIGFVRKDGLRSLPGDLPELKPELVPWKSLYSPDCFPGNYDYNAKTNTINIENPDNGYSMLEFASIKSDDPVHIRIDSLKAKVGSFDSLSLIGAQGNKSLWWEGFILMSIYDNNGNYNFSIRDGMQEDYSYFSGDLGLKASEPIQFIFEQAEGKSFVIVDGDGRQIRQVDVTQLPGLNLPNGLFPEHKARIAASLSPNLSLGISGLQIGAIADGVWVENASMYPGLAELASKHNLTIGTEYSIDSATDLRYCRAMHRDFNVAVLNQFSTSWIWRDGPGQYDFSVLDREVDYAVQQGWRVRASHLIWGDSVTIPDWLKNGQFTRDEYIGFLEKYIKTVVGRYKGRVDEWSIANEAISRSCQNCSGADFWNEKIGPEYIGMAFRWAHEVDPNAILIFNDANNESPRDAETKRVVSKMYDTVKDLKEKGVPIDGVGMEMHLLLKYSSPIAPNKEDVLATMRKFADLGVKIYITEFDVDLHGHPGTPEERLQFEADLYKAMLEACLESNVCASFSTWGVADATSWITQICNDSWCINHPDGDPLMFDNDYNPKPAYFAVRDVLQNFSTPSTP